MGSEAEPRVIPPRYDLRSAYVYSRSVTWRVVIVVAACGGAAEVPAMPSNQGAASVSTVPDLAKLRSLLAPHDRDAFTKDAIENRACPANTLGNYIELLYREGTTGPDHHELVGGCGPFPAHPSMIDPPSDAAYWYCRIDSHVVGSDGEPWHYELRIRVRKRDLDLDFATMSCPGTP